MAFQLSSEDQHKLTALIPGAIAAVETEQALRMQAVEMLAHVVTDAATDNKAEVREWLEPNRLIAWRRACDAARS